MAKIKSILGYTLAALSVPIILLTFMGMGTWMNLLVSSTNVQISPWFTGGEVTRVVDHDRYQTQIHRPVFDALIGERKEGFVQVDWTPKGFAPAQIDEEIDYNGDGAIDFRVQWNTAAEEATVTPYSPEVIGFEGAYQMESAWVVRISLENVSR
jgi:hypothetical protein